MRGVFRAAVSVGCAWFLAACVGRYSEQYLAARERFSRQYRCPESAVRVDELGAGGYRASGCRRSALYYCELVMASDDTVHCRQESTR